MDEISVSENYREELQRLSDVGIISEPYEIEFDEDGNMTEI